MSGRCLLNERILKREDREEVLLGEKKKKEWEAIKKVLHINTGELIEVSLFLMEKYPIHKKVENSVM